MSEKLKILHICPDFPVYSGGGETFDLLSRYWASAGHQVTVITSRPHEAEKKFPENLPYVLQEFRMSNFVRMFQEASLFFPLMRSERRRLKAFTADHLNEYDVILVHGILESVSRTCIGSMRETKNVIVTNHGLSMGSFSPIIKLISSLIYLIFGNIFLRKVKYITFYSNFALEQQARIFGQLPKIVKFKFPLGIDTSHLRDFIENRSHDSVIPKPGYIFAVGRQVRVKGFEILLEAFKSVKAEFPGETLVIAGKKNDYTNELVSLSDRFGLDESVIFMDYIDENKKIEAIFGSDVFVIPSLSEGYGLNSVYARILDVPTVATDTGNHREILSGTRKAVIVEPGNTRQLAGAIMDLLRERDLQPRSPDLAALDYYSIENTAKEYIRIFGQVLAYP